MSRFTRLTAAVLTTAILLTGCWDRKEVNDLALVTAVGIDLKGKSKVELTAQIFVPKSGGGQQSLSGGPPGGGSSGTVRTADGETIADAMSKLQEKVSRTIFWGHNDTYIFGEKLAKNGIRKQVDFLFRYPQPRERANVYVSIGPARNVLELKPPLERNTSEALREFSKSRTGMDVTLMELSKMLSGDAQACAIPLIKIKPAEETRKSSETLAYISGTALLQRDRLVGQIDDKKTRGVLWVRNEIKQAVITIKPPKEDGRISFKMLRSRSWLEPRIQDGDWKMMIHIRAEDDLIQNGTRMNIMNPKLIKSLEKLLDQDIIARTKDMLQIVQKQKKTDILGFAEAFHRKYPREWERMKDRWRTRFADIEVQFDAEVKIRRPGMTGIGANMPEDEVNKP